jgi:hypothetical protein
MGLSTLHSDTGVAHDEAPSSGLGSTRQTLSLDGPWRFRAGADAPWRTINLPGCWESQFPDLRGWAGSAIHERTFTVPESFHGKRVLIHFDAADYYTEVWINEQLVGKHEGGYIPFSFDIANWLRWDGENTVTVRVTDATPEQDVPLPDGSGTLTFAEIPHGKQSWYTPVSGIWQSVWLEARAFVAIEHVSIKPDVDAGVARVRVHLSPAASEASEGHIRIQFEVPEGAGPVDDIVIHIPDGQTEAGVEVQIPNARLWSPETPALYNVTTTLLQGDEVNDVVRTRFGMRKIETREGHVWLNNRPYFIVGALDQAFYPQTIYTKPSLDYLRDQFEKAKQMGLNLMRCHIKVPSVSYLDLCDEMGLLVWYEIPNGQILTPALRERARETLVDMLERDGNHPCIIIHSIMNESWGIDLGDAEQRSWLIETYKWAKWISPDTLIVDNSACIPNFHVVSDLDDYHVYYNIPDQATEFREWVEAFAARNAGSYSGFGDADRRHTEPLLISEFGNWGLPHYDKMIEAEGGIPWWFETGAGITYPSGVLQRFEKQKLSRAFKDYNELADASQEQEWLALKFQIEEMRRHRPYAGYVVTEFTDLNWEANGLLDFGRNPKVFHERLQDINAQDILIPRPERYAYWSGETVNVSVELSKFSGRETEGAKLRWRIGETEGTIEVGATPNADTSALGVITFGVPVVTGPSKLRLDIELYSSDGGVIARNHQLFVFAPTEAQRWGEGKRLWLHDPVGVASGFAEKLQAAGFEVVDKPEQGALAIATYWDAEVNGFVQAGGRAVLAALHPKSLTIASGLGVRLQDRTFNNWWGDWCSSQTWFVKGAFPHLPDTQKFDFEYSTVIPQRALAGATPENVLSGLFVGWLHNPGGYVVRLPVGQGKLVVTTYDVATHFHADPTATLLLRCLADLVV